MAFPKVGVAEASSKIRHIYKQLYPWKSKFECASFLSQQIIHSGDGVVAINKPYGMGLKTVTEEMIGAKAGGKVNMLHTQGAGSTYSLEDVLPIVREQLGNPNLVVVKAAEKYNSGVTILADSSEGVERIRKCILRAKPRKILHSRYFIVSPFTPYEGLQKLYEDPVGIALEKNPMHQYAQPVVVREFSIKSMKRKEVHRARVAFLVTSTSPEGPSLVEVNLTETRSSLLRIYCADMLMPILGDHLYSSRVGLVQGLATRLNPLHVQPGSAIQKVPETTRKKLELQRSEDCVLIPVHAHLRSFILPDFYGRGKDLTINADFPEFFKWTCSRLKLFLPGST